MRRGVLTAAAVLALAALAGAAWIARKRPLPPPRQAAFPVMGTVCRITVYGSEADLTAALAAARAEFARTNAVCSLYDPASEVSRLNAAADREDFGCSELLWQLLLRGEQAHRESGGEFDLTVKPLMDLWGFYRKRGDAPPAAAEIAEARRRVGFEKLRFDRARRTVRFTVPGMALDLGGIAKGEAADRAAAAIAARGIRAGVVDLGGNLKFLPAPPPGRNCYRVAIRDPDSPDRTLPEVLEVAPGRAVSTSGDYERFVTLGGRRYGHIVSPRTGTPPPVPAVTVVADTALDADVYSTSCCLGGAPLAERLRRLRPELRIIFAPGPGPAGPTPGNRVSPTP